MNFTLDIMGKVNFGPKNKGQRSYQKKKIAFGVFDLRYLLTKFGDDTCSGVDLCLGGRTDGWMDGRTDARTDGRRTIPGDISSAELKVHS